jgi:pimeloyl-ACP methyl ester carboxylesterase
MKRPAPGVWPGRAWAYLPTPAYSARTRSEESAVARSVRDVIDWRGQYRHVLDGASGLAPLPPVALLWGERDPVIPITHATATASLLGGAPLTRFPGCGHFPHRQKPTDFVHALEAFLNAPIVGVAD